jgi:hypothetical protein
MLFGGHEQRPGARQPLARDGRFTMASPVNAWLRAVSDCAASGARDRH